MKLAGQTTAILPLTLAATAGAHGAVLSTVKIVIETERGLLAAWLRAAAYQIYPVSAKAVDRYWDAATWPKAKRMRPMRWCWPQTLRTGAHLYRPLPTDSRTIRVPALRCS